MADYAESLVLWQRIAHAAAARPEPELLVFEHPGQVETRSYLQLWENGQRIAQALRQQGLAPGDRFALLMPNHPEFVEAMIAASLTGIVLVPIDPRARGDRLAFMLDHASCQGVLASDDTMQHLQAVRRERSQLRWVLGLRSLKEVLAQPLPMNEDLAADPLAPWQILFTSGSTGVPKAVVMHQRHYIEQAQTAQVLCALRNDDRPCTGLSLAHPSAQVHILGPCLIQGMRGVFSRRFVKSRLWSVARQFDCTTIQLIGGMPVAVYAEPPGADDADNPVRCVLSAGMPAAIWAAFERRFGVEVLDFYSATEGGLTFNPAGAAPVGSIGRPVPSLKHRIVDEAQRDVAPDTRGERQGEMLLRPANGSPANVEYLDDTQASEEKSRDGWLWTGDIVREDAHGWLFFMHRKGEGIQRHGAWIDAGAIEKVIAEDPQVDDVHVYGVPATNGVPGEKNIVAAVVPRADAHFDEQALIARCRQALEAHEVPNFIQLLPEIPRAVSEKPQMQNLLKAFARQPGQVRAVHGDVTATSFFGTTHPPARNS